MHSKGIFSLPSIAAVAAAALVIRWFVFRRREIRSDPPVADDNHTEASNLASTSSSSSDSVAATGVYEVFLSFCGRDTRHGFTDFLYTYLVGASIRTFRDDNELRVGNEISPELLKSIKESKISVPIFSENYASSKWCLLELEQMVHSHENGGQMIYPVFYDVDPSDVRNQTGSYKKGFHQHEKSFGKETVQKWRNALNMVGKMKGLELKKETHGRQGELVKIIVEEILSKLQKNYTHVPEKLVGCDNHIEKMMELLEVDSKDVRIVGIHGMGGLGKTTIAKVIYNQLCECFEGYCFLDNVRENCERHNGTIDLQKQLIKNILKCRVEENFYDYDQGRSRIKDVVSGKKLLIVLDDVDNFFQVDKLMGHQSWFGSQTRIILTTRDKDVLDEIEINCQTEDPPAVYRSYNPDFLDNRDSLQLFSKYAFKRELPVEGYDMLAKEVVSIAAGLPLVLVVLGSTFFPVKDKDIWEEKLRQLRKIPNKEVMGKLKFSFEALEHHEKQIFLDIACLFIGRDKAIASYMWEDCEFYPRLGIRSLISRSLIKIGDDNKFIMHDQLRDLGRQIVYEESLNNLEKQTRLWREEDAMQILDGCQGTSSVVALSLGYDKYDKYDKYSVVASQFRNLSNLRFLWMGVKDVDGNFENLLPNLRWLKCKCLGKFSPINLNMKNLVVLDLSWTSNLTEDWEGWKQLKMVNKLKFLDLSGCQNIRVLPALSYFASLEILKLDYCESLCRLDGLQLLKSLRQLKARNCRGLQTLPNLSNLTKLVELDLNSCDKLIEIHGLEKLESLQVLRIDCCSSLETLPNISNLKNLKQLNASSCAKLIQIVGLHGLNSLEHLDLSYCQILKGVGDVSNLNKLQVLRAPGLEITDFSIFKMLKKLEVFRSNLMEFQGLDRLESLESLNLSDCSSIEALPDLSNLQKLTWLNVSGFVKLTDIHGLEELISLESLNLSDCSSIEALPDLSNLQKLTWLNVSGCVKLTDIHGLEELISLESLDLSECSSIEAFPDLSNLQKLRFLSVPGCVKLTEIRGLETLKYLYRYVDYKGNLVKPQINYQMANKLVKFLDLSGRQNLRVLPDLSIFTSLEILKLDYCESLCRLDGLQLLKSLRQLKARNCRGLQTLPNLSNLTKLVELDLNSCDKLIEIHGLEKLESLQVLRINFCISLETLPNISNLKNLKELNTSSCWKLIQIVGLHGLNSLEHLDLSGCLILEGVGDLSNLNKLQVLRAPGLEITDFSIFKMLKELEVFRSNLMEFQGLDSLEALEDLDIHECRFFERLPDLAYLKRIQIKGCDKLIKVQDIDRLESLESLNLSECSSIEALPDLSNLQKLTYLNVSGCVKLTDIHGLEELISLESLNLSDCSSIEALPDLSNLQKLTYLNVSGCVKLTDIHGLEELISLESLDLSECSSIEALPDLSNLQKLTKLDVSGCVKLTEIHGLETLKYLYRYVDYKGKASI